MDKNGDGKVDMEELKSTFAHGSIANNAQLNVTEDFWLEMFKEIDKDGDGSISFEEFASTMNEQI